MNDPQHGGGGDGGGPGQDATPRLVVGLGASAGGIKALQEFFVGMPPDSGAAFVVVLHLSPEHESHLAEVLQVVTRMPVRRATETIRLEPNHIYVISPNTSLRLADGHLTVSDTLRLEERRAPVDIFFRTLADTHGPRAVSIVLSGTGPDGSNGLKRVNEHGGIVMAQDPRESEHDDMPRNAIATGLVHYVLPVAEMPARLLAMSRRMGDALQDAPQPPADGGLDAVPDDPDADQAPYRSRLLSIQDCDSAPAHRPAAAAVRTAEHRGVLGVPAGSPGRSSGAPARAADQRHALLSRS